MDSDHIVNSIDYLMCKVIYVISHCFSEVVIVVVGRSHLNCYQPLLVRSCYCCCGRCCGSHSSYSQSLNLRSYCCCGRSHSNCYQPLLVRSYCCCVYSCSHASCLLPASLLVLSFLEVIRVAGFTLNDVQMLHLDNLLQMLVLLPYI